MKKKTVILQITNKSNKKNATGFYNGQCAIRGLPGSGSTETYECTAKIYNNSKLTKGVIKSILESGETYIEGFFNLELHHSLQFEAIDFARKEGCFKFNIVSILDPEC
jgi:hypothetical protein